MRNLLVPVVDQALAALKARGALTLASVPAYSVEPPKNAAHGDLSVNVAMMLAKPEGKQPRAIAELIAAELANAPGIAKVDIAGPGFLNVTLTDA
ncbi:MAG TPA: arginine--tRNA ligase, partial [Myxococcota bacterium]